MRMGTFLLGGIVGAVAVVYFNRNNGMLMSNISQAGQSVSNMMNNAKNTISNTSGMNSITSGMNAGSSTNASSGMSTSSSSGSGNMSKVEDIVKKDPNLKNKVDEILKENKETTSAYGMQ